MKRGDICWYSFEPPDKRRPVLILTRDSAIQVLNSVTIAPITTTLRGIPTELLLTPADGMPRDSAANFDNIQTVTKARIGERIAHLPVGRMRQAAQGIAFALGINR